MNNKNNYILAEIAFWLLNKIISEDIRYAVLGDFEEIFQIKIKNEGIFKTLFWLWKQVLKSTPKFIYDKIYWGVVMFRSYV